MRLTFGFSVQCGQKNVKDAYHVVCRGCAAKDKKCEKCLESRVLDAKKAEIRTAKEGKPYSPPSVVEESEVEEVAEESEEEVAEHSEEGDTSEYDSELAEDLEELDLDCDEEDCEDEDFDSEDEFDSEDYDSEDYDSEDCDSEDCDSEDSEE